MLILLSVLAVTLFIGIPVGFSVMISATAFILSTGAAPMSIVVQKMCSGVGTFTMLAMPLFIYSGNLMSYGSTPRLMRLANMLLRKVPGGLGAVGIGGSAFFGTISGAAIATTAAVGSIVGPEMLKTGYKKSYTISMLAAAGTLGGVIPPSICMVIYATSANQSVGKCLMAGFVPGIMAALILILYNGWRAKRGGWGSNVQQEYTSEERRKVLIDALPPLFMPIIILGGTMTGIVTPTESAVVATVYAFILAVFVYKELNLKEIIKVTVDSAVSSAAIMFIISGATPFGWIMTTQNISTSIASSILAFSDSPVVIYALIILALVIIGMFMEAFSTIILITPIFLPVVMSLGMDPIHFGVFLILATCIGAISPPMAACLFTSCKVLKAQVDEAFPDILYIMGVFIVILIVNLMFPQLTLFLPNLIM